MVTERRRTRRPIVFAAVAGVAIGLLTTFGGSTSPGQLTRSPGPSPSDIGPLDIAEHLFIFWFNHDRDAARPLGTPGAIAQIFAIPVHHDYRPPESCRTRGLVSICSSDHSGDTIMFRLHRDASAESWTLATAEEAYCSRSSKHTRCLTLSPYPPPGT